jgi:hypothetical protein
MAEDTRSKLAILMTPAVAINGLIKASGRIPTEDEIQTWISG